MCGIVNKRHKCVIRNSITSLTNTIFSVSFLLPYIPWDFLAAAAKHSTVSEQWIHKCDQHIWLRLLALQLDRVGTFLCCVCGLSARRVSHQNIWDAIHLARRFYWQVKLPSRIWIDCQRFVCEVNIKMICSYMIWSWMVHNMIILKAGIDKQWKLYLA